MQKANLLESISRERQHGAALDILELILKGLDLYKCITDVVQLIPFRCSHHPNIFLFVKYILVSTVSPVGMKFMFGKLRLGSKSFEHVFFTLACPNMDPKNSFGP